MSVASEGSCCVLCIWEMMLYPLSLQELAFAAPALPRKRWQPPQGHPCRPHHLFRPHLRAPSAGALRHFLHAFAAPDSPRKRRRPPQGHALAVPNTSFAPIRLRLPPPLVSCACHRRRPRTKEDRRRGRKMARGPRLHGMEIGLDVFVGSCTVG
jgi:hypothetical protein